MSITVIREHKDKGIQRTFDITEQYEFKRRYGMLNANAWPSLAANLVATWNMQGKRTGHKYSIRGRRILGKA